MSPLYYKESFPSDVQCRLINPAKSNLGKASKILLCKGITIIRTKTGLNQWSNSNQVIEWFQQNRGKSIFFKFDIVAFYPSISEQLFNESIDWAQTYYRFDQQQIEIIRHARESYLFSNSQPWVKIQNSKFDVSMGSFDGAEICEIFGLFLLNKLVDIFGKDNVGLYRDDGLAVMDGSGPEIEKIRKKVFKLFKNAGLKVTIESNITTTSFLDVEFNLRLGTYKPYHKDNDNPIYIHNNSNHPTNIKIKLPQMISQRVSKLSANDEIFKKEAPFYEVKEKSGYKTKIDHVQEKKTNSKTKNRKRNRKVIWFNPPFSDNVQTNIGAKFLKLVDKHFSNKELGNYFNRKNVKVFQISKAS